MCSFKRTISNLKFITQSFGLYTNKRRVEKLSYMINPEDNDDEGL